MKIKVLQGCFHPTTLEAHDTLEYKTSLISFLSSLLNSNPSFQKIAARQISSCQDTTELLPIHLHLELASQLIFSLRGSHNARHPQPYTTHSPSAENPIFDIYL